MTTEEKSGYFNKRPLWQWVLIYLILGSLIYGLIYYFVIAKKGGYDQNSGYNYETSSPSGQQSPFSY